MKGDIKIGTIGTEAAVRGRLLMLLENNPYPHDTRVRLEARALADDGYQVTVICPKAPGQPWKEIIEGVQIRRYPAPHSPDSAWGYLWEYGYSMMAFFVLSLFTALGKGFDVIHAHNPPDTSVLIAAVYKVFGKRFVFDHHELAPELYRVRFKGDGNRAVYQALVWLERLSCRLADHVIATNESYREIEVRRCGVPEQRITVVRNGPDLAEFRLFMADSDLHRDGRFKIGYIGTMGSQDGVDYFLRALRHLVYDLGRTDCYCVLIGDGSAVDSLKALARELGVDQHICFTGWLSAEDFLPLLSATDVCVDPDPSNPFNDRSTMIKMMEYMALGKPIVAFDLPEHRHTAQSAAVYVPPNDELAFAGAIAQLMDDPARRESMGAFGRQRVETELAWSFSEEKLLGLYRALLDGRCSDSASRPWL